MNVCMKLTTPLVTYRPCPDCQLFCSQVTNSNWHIRQGSAIDNSFASLILPKTKHSTHIRSVFSPCGYATSPVFTTGITHRRRSEPRRLNARSQAVAARLSPRNPENRASLSHEPWIIYSSPSYRTQARPPPLARTWRSTAPYGKPTAATSAILVILPGKARLR